LSVTHLSARQVSIGNHGGSVNGQDCTSCHYVGGRQRLTPPTAGVFGTGSISGG
jgi:cytochrome c2